MSDNAQISVLYVVSSFFPAIAYGGPIFSLKLLTDGIAARSGFQVKVLTTDSADPSTKDRLQLQSNPTRFPAGYDVHYCRTSVGSRASIEFFRRLYSEISQVDIVHLTGPYDFPVLPTLFLSRLLGSPLSGLHVVAFRRPRNGRARPKDGSNACLKGSPELLGRRIQCCM